MVRSHSRRLMLTLVAGLLISSPALAQREPVRNWAAPLYWQPSEQEASIIRHAREMQPMAGTSAAQPMADPSVPLVLVAMTPCRVVDTRAGQGFSGSFGQPRLAGGVARTFPIQSNTTCPILSTAQAYSFNVTVVPPGPLGYLTVYPTGQPLPLAATLNSLQGYVVGNAAIVAAGTSGSIDVFASNATDLVIDINGYYASLTGLQNNTAMGNGALVSITTGANNTASGTSALPSNTTGNDNTASGTNALQSNTTGSFNTASGTSALQSNTTGNENTASGTNALQGNTTGSWNTASGINALQGNTTGSFNTASGTSALQSNTTGNDNTASGINALQSNTTGQYNTASGTNALQSNTTGSFNTASGFFALVWNTTGNSNIAIGFEAASSVSGGNSNNIHIGSSGAAADSGTIRIGTPGMQTSFFAAGVRGVTTGVRHAIPVVIDSNGQLGTVSSSRRFKEDIQDMADASSGLLRLRPVTFHYKKPYADGSKPLDYRSEE